MKIAVFDTHISLGGVIRYISNLLPEIKNYKSETEITYFCNVNSLKQFNYYDILADSGIKIEELASLIPPAPVPFKLTFLQRTINFFLGIIQLKPIFIPPALAEYDFQKEVKKEIEQICLNYDLAFFPFSYNIPHPQTKCPKVGTFHDFNFKYFFGSAIFYHEHKKLLEAQTKEWLKDTVPIVSTNFIKEELLKFYPNVKNIHVVHLAPPALFLKVSRQQALKNLADLNINGKYILYPCNTNVHKNIGTLCTAVYLLNLKGHEIKLVLTGNCTDLTTGKASYLSVDTAADNPDIIGLGYVSDESIDSLILCARAVVSCSFYEAGNGPGLEAWSRGVPVAMSNIPQFLEHLELQGVRAQVFDPKDPKDIADKLEYILKNEELVKADALISQENINKYKCSNVAEKYWNIFDRVIKEGY